ncbi:MAG: hypothetical protein WDA16_13155 [Candidatus Thermoplasmatota archaeon]
MRFALFVLVVSLPLYSGFGAASTGACDSGDSLSLGIVEISPTDDPSLTFYVTDLYGEASPAPVHLYQESNDVFVREMSLQRDWREWFVFHADTTCAPDGWEFVTPDTLLF